MRIFPFSVELYRRKIIVIIWKRISFASYKSYDWKENVNKDRRDSNSQNDERMTTQLTKILLTGVTVQSVIRC
jgi:hypothetical protein